MMPRFMESLTLLTPLGHEIWAEMDYERGELLSAKVVHAHTGVMRPLARDCRETLERALRARQVYEHALAETSAIEDTLQGYGSLLSALGAGHPALKPYHKEAEQHRQIARDMQHHAERYYENALSAIDALAEK